MGQVVILVEVEADDDRLQHDIARLRDRIKELEERERELTTFLFDRISDIVAVIDPDGKVSWVTPSVKTVLGYEVEEFLGRSFQELGVLKEDGQRDAEERMGRTFQMKGTAPFEYDIRAKDGSIRCLEVTSSPLVEDGKVVCMVIIARDISVRNKAQETLMERESLLGAIFDQSTEAIVYIDQGLTIRSASLAVKEIFDYLPEELIGKQFFQLDIMTPEAMERSMEYAARVLEGEGSGTIEYEIMAKDGSIRHVEATAAPLTRDGKVKGILTVARDVTERRRTLEELAESKERFRRLVDNAPDIVFRWSMDKGLEYVSPVVSSITGYSAEELMSDPMLGLKVIGGDNPDILMEYDRVQDKPGLEPSLIVKFTRKDGAVAHLAAKFVPIESKDGYIEAFEGILRDVTAQVEAEERLRQSEESYRQLIDNVFDVVLTIDLDLRFMSVSRSVQTFGYEPEDLEGRMIDEVGLLDERGVELATMEIMRALELGERPAPLEFEIIGKDGIRRIGEFIAAPMKKDGQPMGFRVVGRDITDRRRAEELARARAREEISSFMVSAIPVFVSNVPSQVRDSLIGAFADRYERNFRERFLRDTGSDGDGRRSGDGERRSSSAVFKDYISWISSFFSNLGISVRTGEGVGTGDLTLSECPWSAEARGNPVFCLICRAMVMRSFTWSGLEGAAKQWSSIWGGAKECRFDFAFRVE